MLLDAGNELITFNWRYWNWDVVIHGYVGTGC